MNKRKAAVLLVGLLVAFGLVFAARTAVETQAVTDWAEEPYLQYWFEGPVGEWHPHLYNPHVFGEKSVAPSVGLQWIELRFPTPQTGNLTFWVYSNHTVWVDGVAFEVVDPFGGGVDAWFSTTIPVDGARVVRFLCHSWEHGVDGVVVV